MIFADRSRGLENDEIYGKSVGMGGSIIWGPFAANSMDIISILGQFFICGCV